MGGTFSRSNNADARCFGGWAPTKGRSHGLSSALWGPPMRLKDAAPGSNDEPATSPEPGYAVNVPVGIESEAVTWAAAVDGVAVGDEAVVVCPVVGSTTAWAS